MGSPDSFSGLEGIDDFASPREQAPPYDDGVIGILDNLISCAEAANHGLDPWACTASPMVLDQLRARGRMVASAGRSRPTVTEESTGASAGRSAEPTVMEESTVAPVAEESTEDAAAEVMEESTVAPVAEESTVAGNEPAEVRADGGIRSTTDGDKKEEKRKKTKKKKAAAADTAAPTEASVAGDTDGDKKEKKRKKTKKKKAAAADTAAPKEASVAGDTETSAEHVSVGVAADAAAPTAGAAAETATTKAKKKKKKKKAATATAPEPPAVPAARKRGATNPEPSARAKADAAGCRHRLQVRHHAVAAGAAPAASVSPAAGASAAEEPARCMQCTSIVDFEKIGHRLMRKSTPGWVCAVCNAKSATMYRLLGSWPTADFKKLSKEERLSFWIQSGEAADSESLKELYIHKLTKQATRETREGTSGCFKPLSVWANEGFNATLIEDSSTPESREFNKDLGVMTYRVRLHVEDSLKIERKIREEVLESMATAKQKKKNETDADGNVARSRSRSRHRARSTSEDRRRRAKEREVEQKKQEREDAKNKRVMQTVAAACVGRMACVLPTISAAAKVDKNVIPEYLLERAKLANKEVTQMNSQASAFLKAKGKGTSNSKFEYTREQVNATAKEAVDAAKASVAISVHGRSWPVKS